MPTPPSPGEIPPIPYVLLPKAEGQHTGLGGQPIAGRGSDGRVHGRDVYQEVEEEKSLRPIDTGVSPSGAVWLLALLSTVVAYFLPGFIAMFLAGGQSLAQQGASAVFNEVLPTMKPVPAYGVTEDEPNFLEMAQPVILPVVAFLTAWLVTVASLVICLVKASNASAILGFAAFFVLPLLVWFVAPAWIEGFYFYAPGA